MLRHSVTSSRIRAIGYDLDKRILEIAFHNGEIYQYLDVPERIYKKYISDAVVSKGRFFDGVIKGKFLCHQLA
ncbi:KTSC domain-containing protein [Candidatus Symbiopectobacterium sp. 'North America']|uniref:KTSC domain-containing protein n=1 Tax=Candidatus Symbiopectobacterium sp. 'North America' TaxID=2794574 RepID=UPI0018C965A9|nr:KTSC domain-containing protein [Candidatus Symbiopectobacterium sp. 'North America']MBG6245012.1 KTSC domain-containing protein [Candidatus Symbiopectobacterium sp. 'North America']